MGHTLTIRDLLVCDAARAHDHLIGCHLFFCLGRGELLHEPRLAPRSLFRRRRTHATWWRLELMPGAANVRQKTAQGFPGGGYAGGANSQVSQRVM